MQGVQVTDKIKEIFVKDTHSFINTDLGHHLPAIHLVSFLEGSHVSSELPLVEYCTTLREEHLLVA
jgi:hypothetical protein